MDQYPNTMLDARNTKQLLLLKSMIASGETTQNQV